ncbi:MAG: hypothetical protein J0M18_15735, partial [Ignavibacteria bacterium]|nr:hypothetical protein [Ignavibacteria bacterium]
MRKIILQLSLLLLIISDCCFSQGHNIEIKYSRPPLNQLNANNLWDFTLINTSPEDLEFFLYGTLTEKKAGPIANGTTVSIKLKKGEVKKFKISDLSQTPEINYVHSDPRYKEALIRAGNLPDGEYEICVTAKRTGTNEELGKDCMEQVLTAESDASLNLISPENNIKINAEEPLVFSWVLIGTQSKGYKIKIVEILGDESPENAMLKNKAFFEKEEIKLNSLRLPSNVKIEPNKKYAWQVSSGETMSEVRVFSLRDEPSTIVCSDFENFPLNPANVSSIGNWRVYNSGNMLHPQRVRVRNDGTNGHIMTGEDYSGGTFLVNTSDYQGDWSGYCSFCFDIRLISDGGSYSPPLEVSNSVYIFKGLNVNQKLNWPTIAGYNSSLPNNPTIGFGFTLNATRNETSGWQSVCLPLREIGPNDPLPANTWGTWVSTGNTLGGHATVQEAWNDIIHDVDVIAFAIDCTGDNQSEVIGVDNICLEEECIETNSDPCNSYSATAVRMDGKCCWEISVNNPINTTGVDRIRIRPDINEGTEFSSVTANLPPPASQWMINNTPQSVTIRRHPMAMPMPSGTLTNIFNYCISYTNVPQHVIVEWMNGSEQVVCSDTLESSCDIPCATLTAQSIECVGNNVELKFNIQNTTNQISTGHDISKIEVLGVTPAGVSATPSIINLTTPIPSGGSSTLPVSLTLNGANAGEEVCIKMLFTSSNGCCSCIDTLCIVIPECICDKVDAQLTGNPISCQYRLSLINNYAGNYFTGVNIRTLDDVSFAGWNFLHSDWGTYDVFPSSEIHMNYCDNTSCFVPTGNSNVIEFSLQGYEATSPQYIVVEWMNNNDVVCRDTLQTPCQPPVPEGECISLINPQVLCQSDGSFKFTFTLRNDADFTANGFQFSGISPSTLTFTSNEIITTIPQNGLYNAEVTINGANPGDVICFEMALFKYGTNSDGSYIYNSNGSIRKSDCCYLDTCFTFPSCPTSCSCENGRWNIQGNNIEFNSKGNPVSRIFECGASFNVDANSTVLLSPDYTCPTQNCEASYKYSVNGGPLTSFVPSPYSVAVITSTVTVKIFAYCGDKLCDSCNVTLIPLPDKPCLQVMSVKDVKCSGPNGTGGNNYTLNVTIDNSSGSPVSSSLFSLNCGTLSGLPSTIPIGTNTYTLTVSTNSISTTTCCIIFNGLNCQSEKCFDLPPCPQLCDCGKWKTVGSMEYFDFENGNNKTVKLICNESYGVLKTGQPVTINKIFICEPSDCKTTYDYILYDNNANAVLSGTNLSMPITFTPVTTGGHRLVITPKCGGKECKPCEIYLKIEGTIECNCHKWLDGTIKYSDFENGNSTKDESLICEKKFGTITTGLPVTIDKTFICDPENCIALYDYTLFNNSGTPVLSGTNLPMPITFTPVTLGSHTLEITPKCGIETCRPCKIYLYTDGKEKCDCGKWEEIKQVAYHEKGEVKKAKIECFDKVPIKFVNSGSTVSFNSKYYCNSDCETKYVWELIDMSNNSVVTSNSTNTIPIDFTAPSATSSYQFKVYTYCGEIKCDSCSFVFETRKDDETCKCSPVESSITINGKSYSFKCGTGITNDVYEGEVVTINPGLSCSSKDCIKKTSWNITGPGSFIQSGSTLPITFSPPNAGIYQITSYIVCGTDTCRCFTKIKVQKKQTCDCGTSKIIQIDEQGGETHKLRCDTTILIGLNKNLTITPLNFCSTSECLDSVKYTVRDLQMSTFVTGGTLHGSSPIPFNITLLSNAGYIIEFTAYCKGIECKCKISIRTKATGCDCDYQWGLLPYYNGVVNQFLNCGNTISIKTNTQLNFSPNPNTFKCIPNSPVCNTPKYKWELTGPSARTYQG